MPARTGPNRRRAREGRAANRNRLRRQNNGTPSNVNAGNDEAGAVANAENNVVVNVAANNAPDEDDLNVAVVAERVADVDLCLCFNMDGCTAGSTCGGMSCACPGGLEVRRGIVEAKHVTLERHSSSAADLTNTNSCQLNWTLMTPTNLRSTGFARFCHPINWPQRYWNTSLTNGFVKRSPDCSSASTFHVQTNVCHTHS